MFLKIV